jgi:hypothetical protein
MEELDDLAAIGNGGCFFVVDGKSSGGNRKLKGCLMGRNQDRVELTVCQRCRKYQKISSRSVGVYSSSIRGPMEPGRMSRRIYWPN